MKTAIKILSLFFLILLGCSKDDNSTEEMVIPPNEKFLNTITEEDGTVALSFEFNTDKNLERMKYADVGLFIYGYQGNQITSMDTYLGGEEKFTFTYDANGHLNTFTLDDVITNVTYNAAQNFYLYAKVNGDEESIFLDSDGDVKKFVSYDSSENETSTIAILYEDGDYKGSLTNTNNPVLATCLANPNYNVLFFLYNLSTKPIRTVAVDGIFDFQNTFDEQSFIKTATTNIGNSPKTLNYNYIKL